MATSEMHTWAWSSESFPLIPLITLNTEHTSHTQIELSQSLAIFFNGSMQGNF